jgi:UDP-N-acetylmuramate dehydrogenase
MTTPAATRIRENVPLAPFTSWKVGGPARYLCEPTEGQASEVIRWARERALPLYFLGRGSNVLVPDAGLPGLVLLTRNSMIGLDRRDDHIVAGAGVSLPKLSTFAAGEGFSGYEFMIGIPGTVGGAIAMNAGLTVFRPRELREVVDSFDVIDSSGRLETLTMDAVRVRYRHTDLLDGDRLLIRARFKLETPGDPAALHQATVEHLRERKSKQPLDKPTAGSTFKSPPGARSAGWLIEHAGLKSFRIGGAMVSPKHANWIENLGDATATDIRRLIDHIQTEVERHAGVRLEPEVRFLA